MNLQKTTLLILVTLILSTNLLAHDGFKITIKLDGLTDSTLLLASYIGDKQFVVDTAYADKQHTFKFEADTLLPEGMYIIATGAKSKLFDFIVSGKENIYITGEKSKLPSSLTSKYDDENRILFEYIKFLAGKQKEMSVLQASKKRFAPGNDSLKVLQALIDNLDDEVQRHIKGIINTNKGKFISVFLNTMQDPELAATPLLPNGRPDSIAAFNQYKAHFWDNIDLSDDRVIRTPIIHSKVEQYLTKLTVPAPDSIITSIDRLFQLSGSNKETFKYLSWYLTIKYEGSEIMGQDAVFVHIVDKYFDDPRMSWMNKTVRQNLINRANTLRPILLGKPAPEMILIDTLQTPRSLYSVKTKYTLIYFWDPECSHCKKETPLLKKFYDEYRDLYEVEIYAVCMDTSWKSMKQYIIKNNMNWINVNGYYSMTPDFRELYDVHSSPVMYLLDEKKTIIAKRILTDQIKTLLEKINTQEK
ncbi:MAG TPA: thioredoxin-like domain-containing protein [Lentimicrobium sp.]|nr:thioredoxin-like domain-containing protein [Lentimicrobium sp.]